MARINYDKNFYCDHCDTQVTITEELLRCPDCNRKLRTRPHKNIYLLSRTTEVTRY